MRVFVATRYGHRLRSDFQTFLGELDEMPGMRIISSWHWDEEEDPSRVCRNEIDQSQAVVIWGVDLEAGGGLWFEAGWALAQDIPVILYEPVGKSTSVIYRAECLKASDLQELAQKLEWCDR